MGHFVLPGKNAVLQPPLENVQIRQTIFVRFSNMATNQATVNPPVPVTILKLRYVIRIKQHLHNRIEIIEIERH